MRQVQAGHPEAFARLFDRHHRALFSFLRRLGMTAGAAEDLVQETFLRVWNARERFRTSGTFRAFLYAIARNLWISQLRRGPLDAPRFLETRGREAGDPAGDAERRETVARLNRAVAGLPEDLRVPFVLKRFQGLTFSEVARALEIGEREAEDRVAEAFRKVAAGLKAGERP